MQPLRLPAHVRAGIIAVAILLGAHHLSAAELPKIDIPTIQAALDDYRGGFQTLVGSYQRQSASYATIQAGHSLDELRWDIAFRVDLERGWISTERTKTWKFNVISTTEPFRLFERRTFDGTHTYRLLHSLGALPAHLEFDPELLDLPTRLTVYLGNRDQEEFHPWIAAGLRGRFGTPGLAERLRQHESQLTGVEPIDGVACYIVAIGDTLKVALDPNRSFLPRRMHFLTPESREFETYESLEFQRYSDAETGEEWWFPSHSRCLTPTNRTEFLIENLSRNESLPLELFRIDPDSLPAGVAVIRQLGGKPTESFFTGDREDLWNQHQQAFAELDREIEALLAQQSSPAENLPPATPPVPRGTTKSDEEVSPIVSLTLLGIAILGFWLIRWRRRGR